MVGLDSVQREGEANARGWIISDCMEGEGLVFLVDGREKVVTKWIMVGVRSHRVTLQKLVIQLFQGR